MLVKSVYNSLSEGHLKKSKNVCNDQLHEKICSISSDNNCFVCNTFLIQIYLIKPNKYIKLHRCLRQMCFQMVSIYNLENAGRKLKPYHLICFYL